MKDSKTFSSSSDLLEFREHINSILQRCQTRKNHLELLLNLYEFYESVNNYTHQQTLVFQIQIHQILKSH